MSFYSQIGNSIVFWRIGFFAKVGARSRSQIGNFFAVGESGVLNFQFFVGKMLSCSQMGNFLGDVRPRAYGLSVFGEAKKFLL